MVNTKIEIFKEKKRGAQHKGREIGGNWGREEGVWGRKTSNSALLTMPKPLTV